jgi:hypothetical protein
MSRVTYSFAEKLFSDLTHSSITPYICAGFTRTETVKITLDECQWEGKTFS